MHHSHHRTPPNWLLQPCKLVWERVGYGHSEWTNEWTLELLNGLLNISAFQNGGFCHTWTDWTEELTCCLWVLVKAGPSGLGLVLDIFLALLLKNNPNPWLGWG